MPRRATLTINKKSLNNLFKARQVSQMLALGNVIQKKRLNATLKSLPTQVAKQVTKGMKNLGLSGGKRKTRKLRRGSKTRRGRRY